jgi:hypothetical protein
MGLFDIILTMSYAPTSNTSFTASVNLNKSRIRGGSKESEHFPNDRSRLQIESVSMIAVVHQSRPCVFEP